MKWVQDEEMCGWALIGEGAIELVDEAIRANLTPNVNRGYTTPSNDWNGRTFSGWGSLKKALSEPWEESIVKMNQMLDELNGMDLPVPKSRKRKGLWSEEQGEVDSDRALCGEPGFYRDHKRQNSRGPNTVALLANLDAYGGDSPEEIFWRGAATVAAVDLLEKAGYLVEVWMWCAGKKVYTGHYAEQFTASRLKEAGNPVDIDTLLSGLSAWYLRSVVFGSFAGCPTAPKGLGGPVFEIQGWRKHLDITEGCKELAMPIAMTKEEAIDAAIGILNEVISSNE